MTLPILLLESHIRRRERVHAGIRQNGHQFPDGKNVHHSYISWVLISCGSVGLGFPARKAGQGGGDTRGACRTNREGFVGTNGGTPAVDRGKLRCMWKALDVMGNTSSSTNTRKGAANSSTDPLCSYTWKVLALLASRARSREPLIEECGAHPYLCMQVQMRGWERRGRLQCKRTSTSTVRLETLNLSIERTVTSHQSKDDKS
ncbi:hypothetical protein EDB92DRAFT_1898866 [Lactarius akahatsu]|uniref:Uncharacterized protein n=1 Tax=Lactarius akahatsu TaxID=416441 RepID=A0AAD4Q8Y3_9AGAM|nr:hypothetical protein EDB92DRAFT_1898866 [Lactarius akahatsu]